MNISADLTAENTIKTELEKRNDPEALRIRRFLQMPDLSRTEESPIAELVKRIIALPDFADFDIVTAPEIVSADKSFDLFDFPSEHPVRSRSDTYYVDDSHILRTHTTIMWYYHLQQKSAKEEIAQGQNVGALSWGKVYRKDKVDQNHMNVFHQMDGWFLCPRDKKIIGSEDLKEILIKIARAIFGPDVKYRFNPDTFPYTEPSLEMEIEVGGRWVEVLGSGVVKGKVLDNLGVDSTQYNGWAFGFGLERLAILSMDLPDIRLLWSEDERVKRQLKLGQKYQEVSKYPPITRDISFVTDKNFVPNNYFDLIRDLGGNLIEEMTLLDKYEDEEKFGPERVSYSYRIIYRSLERTLTDLEIKSVQEKIESETRRQFNAEIR